jgi:hypothetical protein
MGYCKLVQYLLYVEMKNMPVYGMQKLIEQELSVSNWAAMCGMLTGCLTIVDLDL